MKKIVVLGLLFTVNAWAQAPMPVDLPPPAASKAEAPKAETPKEPAAAPAAPAKQADQVPSPYRPDPISFNAKLGVGSAFGPNALWFSGSLEAQLDKFVAIGPTLQYGTSSSVDYLFTSIGPRFTIPMSVAEFGLHMGFGAAYRNVVGFEFTNFLFNSGINLDVYLLQNCSVGLNYDLNTISSASDSFMSALTVSVAGHF